MWICEAFVWSLSRDLVPTWSIISVIDFYILRLKSLDKSFEEKVVNFQPLNSNKLTNTRQLISDKGNMMTSNLSPCDL